MSFKKLLIVGLLILFACWAQCQNLIIYRSDTSVEQTTKKLVAQLEEAGLTYYEIVNHEEVAAASGKKIPPTRLVLFEDPNLVSELITCRQTTALEMPLKMLVWQENGDVYLGFVDPKLMRKQFLLQGCEEVLDQLTRLMIKIASKVVR